MGNIDLTPFGIERPEKISWAIEATSKDALELIQSKSVRSFLRQSHTLLEEAGIMLDFKELSLESFLQWLPFYEAKMSEHEYDILANSEWFHKRQAEGKKIYGLFFYKADQLVGSGIITVGNDKGTLSFKASERIDLSSKTNSSFGSIIDYLFMQKILDMGLTHISGGTSRNAFGVINTIGYLDYKLRLGYAPSPAKTAVLLSEVPLNDEGLVLFYGLKGSQLSLYALTNAEHSGQFEVSRFATEEIPFVHLRYN
jgi:hypothetical protein